MARLSRFSALLLRANSGTGAGTYAIEVLSWGDGNAYIGYKENIGSLTPDPVTVGSGQALVFAVGDRLCAGITGTTTSSTIKIQRQASGSVNLANDCTSWNATWTDDFPSGVYGDTDDNVRCGLLANNGNTEDDYDDFRCKDIAAF